MPKLARELKDIQVKNAKPGDILSDGKGLHLLVDASGNKRWVLRYIRPDGRRNAIGLGSYSKSVGLAAARTLAQKARDLLAEGKDPAEESKENSRQKKAVTRGSFEAVSNEWHKHKARGWASETARKAREVLDDHLFPKLGKKLIKDITTADIKPSLLTLHERAPRLAVKARQYCNQIIDYAIQEGLREDGRFLSLRGALPKAPKGHYAAVTKSNGLPDLVKAINGISSFQSRAAILLCLYTASRPGVVVGARWEEIDLKSKEWHIPASRMKTDNDHITPLPQQAVELLKQLKQLAGESDFVFPSSTAKLGHIHRDSLSKILRENGLKGVTVTHGFRATFRTIARERLRADADVLEAQLAHAKRGEVQAAYDRTQFLEERHILIQQWADFLEALAKGAQVIPLHRTA